MSEEALENLPPFPNWDHHRRFHKFFIPSTDLSLNIRFVRRAGVSLMDLGTTEEDGDAVRWYIASLNNESVFIRLGSATMVWPVTPPEADVYARRIDELKREHEEREELLEQQISDLEKEIEGYEAERERLNLRLKDVQEELYKMTKEKDQAWGAWNTKKKEHADQVNINQGLTQDVLDLREQLDDAKKKRRNDSSRLSKCKKARDEAEKKLAEAHQFILRLREENEELLRRNEELMRENDQLRNQRLLPSGV